MTQYNTLNVKLSNSQLNKVKSEIKNETQVTLNLSSNLIGCSNDKITFLHKLLLTDTQVSKIRKAFANGSSANIKFSKTQLSKMIQSGGFGSLDYFIAPIKWIAFSTQNGKSFGKEKIKFMIQQKQLIIL